jgi:hypothetical protein
LENVLQHPNAAMIAGHMPPVNASGPELKALVAYLGTLGSPPANAPSDSSAGSSPPAPDTALQVRPLQYLLRQVRSQLRDNPRLPRMLPARTSLSSADASPATERVAWVDALAQCPR